MEKTSELNQLVYFKDVLNSHWKPGDVLCWGRGFALISTGEEKLWIPSKLIKIALKKRNLLRKRNDSSSTMVTTIHVVKKPYRVVARFYSCLYKKIHIFKNSRDPGYLDDDRRKKIIQ